MQICLLYELAKLCRSVYIYKISIAFNWLTDHVWKIKVAEGVAGPDNRAPIQGDASGGDQADYRQKLTQIRLVYSEELRKYEEVGSVI